VPIATRAAASDALRDAAVATYKAKFNKPPIRLPDIFAKSPVPENSLAGQEFYRDDKKETKPTLSKSEVPEKQLRATFATIAKLYGGEDNALTMVSGSSGMWISARWEPFTILLWGVVRLRQSQTS
jgi:hypothetical protein